MSWIEYVFIGLVVLLLIITWVRFWHADLTMAVVNFFLALLLLVPAFMMGSTPLFWTVGVLLVLGVIAPFAVCFIILDWTRKQDANGG